MQEEICFRPIGWVRTEAREIPRHHSVSNVRGEIHILPKYEKGLKDIKPGDEIYVIFHFHLSPPFEEKDLVQEPPHLPGVKLGVFSTCSPRRPNPIGLSVLKVIRVRGNVLEVERIDMFDGTPVLDIKPFKPPQAVK
ncbi:MAG: tRNA (N6-threonylcarbamoyladenosine(37)-N6)-methyltransferase TrmO [Thermodesulfobacteria bacterium]|nr:tRNA (N6-threonylcarbamoyladenosine(37)-N6)-methyltransferase TrmO [Thermodesulfobacteriota bacterium]